MYSNMSGKMDKASILPSPFYFHSVSLPTCTYKSKHLPLKTGGEILYFFFIMVKNHVSNLSSDWLFTDLLLKVNVKVNPGILGKFSAISAFCAEFGYTRCKSELHDHTHAFGMLCRIGTKQHMAEMASLNFSVKLSLFSTKIFLSYHIFLSLWLVLCVTANTQLWATQVEY